MQCSTAARKQRNTKNIRGGTAMDAKKISRREFITETGVTLAGTGVLLNQLGTHPAFGATTAPLEKKKSKHPMAYRTLGKTGRISMMPF